MEGDRYNYDTGHTLCALTPNVCGSATVKSQGDVQCKPSGREDEQFLLGVDIRS